MPASRQCNVCGTEYARTSEYWYGQPKQRDGLSETCKRCSMARARANYAANREARLARHREYHKANAAKICAETAEWRRNNPERTVENRRLLYERDKAKAMALRKEWRRNNPDRVRALSVKEKAKRKRAPGSFTAADLRAQREKQNDLCFYCKCDISQKYTVDHVLAIANGGTNDPSNIVLACLACNLAKGTKLHFTPRG